MDGKSLNITEEKLIKLKEIIPEAFTENKIDWEKLRAALGDDIEFKNERYVLNWAGKSDAFRVLQSPTTATLVPEKDESVNFDITENIFIEGENLEVLKVLQKAYFGKIKMIYIDPPYNTGNDNFIYPDKFSETKEEYLSRIGDKDETGYLTREGLFRKNSKDSGHYHSNWLSMMYPRLFLARNLLQDDGLIFVSIDDNEVANLMKVCNEVFGEENYIGMISRATGTRMGTGSRGIARELDYLLVYSKIDIYQLSRLPMTVEEKALYNEEDSKGKYLTRSLRRTGGENRREDRPSMYYPINSPDGKEVYPIAPEGWQSRWVCGKETYEYLLKDGYIEWKKITKKGKEKWQVYQKHYLNDAGKESSDLWSKEEGNKKATRDLNALFDSNKVFDHPKPIGLIRKLLQMGTAENEESNVLDFFSGSCTTAHAVLDLNKEDGGNRKFICVQLPEKCDENSEAYKAGYKTIAEIGKERIRRVIKKIKEEQDGKLDLDGNAEKQDLGFKVFKLQKSNFKIWRTKIENEEQLVEQLHQHLEPLDENTRTENVLYELLLKSGVPLTAKIEKKDGFYLVNDTEIALILEKVDKEIIKMVIDAKPQKVITIDRLFNNNDQLKTNTALQMKDAEIEFKVV